MTPSLRWAWPLIVAYLVACGGRTEYDDEFVGEWEDGGLPDGSVTGGGGRSSDAGLGGQNAGGIAQGAAGATPWGGWPGYGGRVPLLGGYGNRPIPTGGWGSGGWTGGRRATGGIGIAGRRPTGGMGVAGWRPTGGMGVAGWRPTGGMGVAGWRPTGGTGVAGWRPTGGTGVAGWYPVGGRRPTGGAGYAGRPWGGTPNVVTCTECVESMCWSPVEKCFSLSICIDGLMCSVLNCPSSDLACALKCFQGDVNAALAGLNAVSCVVSQCGASCVSGLPVPLN